MTSPILVDVLRCPMGDWQQDAEENYKARNNTIMRCPRCNSRPLDHVIVVRRIQAKQIKLKVAKCWKCGRKLESRPYGWWCRKCEVYRKIRAVNIKPSPLTSLTDITEHGETMLVTDEK